MAANILTQSKLKELLYYDPETGIFIWLFANSKRIKAGDIAGCLRKDGYVVIRINKRDYKAHRLAWLYMTGELPELQTDHTNHIRDDNKWENLRESTHQENGKNRSMYKNNTSDVTGVGWDKRENKWRSRIHVNDKSKFIGYFSDKFEAICARKSADNKYGFHENHGGLK